ncbi:MAG: hypothetical protein K0U41_09045 [Gammaproteobacteria bacterium]|nr:hypothetical protein [Gammaproteobacteria bacterium]
MSDFIRSLAGYKQTPHKSVRSMIITGSCVGPSGSFVYLKACIPDGALSAETLWSYFPGWKQGDVVRIAYEGVRWEIDYSGILRGVLQNVRPVESDYIGCPTCDEPFVRFETEPEEYPAECFLYKNHKRRVLSGCRHFRHRK